MYRFLVFNVNFSPITSIIWYWLQVRGQWCHTAGKVTVGLASHRLQWFIHLRAQGLSKGDEHPTNTAHGAWYSVGWRHQSGRAGNRNGPKPAV